MSRFQVQKIDSKVNIGYFGDNLTLSCTDERWKNFKPFRMVKDYPADAKMVAEIYEDDVFVCTFPRSGTTLTQEMVWLILNDFDFGAAKSKLLDARFPEFEFAEFEEDFHFEGDVLSTMRRPRTLKTHLPVYMLPDQVWTKRPKLIHVYRDVKDAAISFYHLHKDLYHANMSLEDFLDAFLKDEILFCPYREHVLDYLNLRNYNNILYLTYEGILEDIEGSIKKVAQFLGKEVSDTNMEKLKKHLQVDSMQANKACNKFDMLTKVNDLTQEVRRTDTFIRRGIVGSHKTEMPEEYIKRFDEWMKEDVKSGWESQ